jgi:hypothetical protein
MRETEPQDSKLASLHTGLSQVAALYASGEDRRVSGFLGRSADRFDQAAADVWAALQFQGSRSATLLAG